MTSDRLSIARLEHTAALRAVKTAWPGRKAIANKRLEAANREVLEAEAEQKRAEKEHAA